MVFENFETKLTYQTNIKFPYLVSIIYSGVSNSFLTKLIKFCIGQSLVVLVPTVHFFQNNFLYFNIISQQLVTFLLIMINLIKPTCEMVLKRLTIKYAPM